MDIKISNISRPISIGKTVLATSLCAVLVLLASSSFATVTKAAKPKPKPIAGGANQVEGLNGKIGDTLFDGQWRFQALSILPVTSYTLSVQNSEQDYSKWSPVAEYDNASFTFTPKPGYAFYALKCHVKNAQNTTQQLDCYGNDPKTALADTNADSYPPVVYDMHTQGPLTTKPLLPGSGEDITVLFAVDTGITPQSIVFTLKNWSSNVGKNVRVTIAPTQ